MATAAGPSCGPSAPGVKPPSVLRPGCCCYMQEIANCKTGANVSVPMCLGPPL